MKINESKESEGPVEFRPIKMEITLETLDEARLFWHLGNTPDLTKSIFSLGYKKEDGCVPRPVIRRLPHVFWVYIEEEMKKQGLK